jgi:hypothetical protein
MGVYTGPQYVAELNRRIANMRRRKNIVIGDIVEYTANVARKYAPYRTGRLRKGIRANKSKGTVTAFAMNPTTGFAYIHWVNQTRGRGMTTLNVKTKSGSVNIGPKASQPIWVPVQGRRMVYGRAPSNWRWTGKARFFDLAIMDARKRFLPTVRKEVLYAGLRGTV